MIAYIFKSSLSLILLFGLYWFLLRKEKLFIFNRFFLVLSIGFSLILPFISIPIKFQTTQELKNIIHSPVYIIPEISTSENIISQDIQIGPSSVEIQPSGINIEAILVIFYISGTILFLLRFLKNIYTMYRQIRLSEKIRFVGYRLILTNEKSNPYCFFNNIFLNRNDYLNGRIDNDLLNHELMHIKQYHSVDIVFLELIKIFYWFNPVYLLYDRAIRINHEYLADHGVIHDDYDIKNYSDKLLSLIFRRSNIPLSSGSNHSFTKKRLLMMTKTKSKSSVYGIRIAITLSVILVFSLFLSFKLSDKQQSNKEIESSGSTYMQAQTVKDIDGNEYKTVTIGNQVWMAENLKTTRYNDGKNIRMVTDSTEWQQYEQAFCWYNNKTENKNEYGALYNWYAVNTNKLCPIGWHVPVKEELLPLMKFSSKDTLIGGTMKEAGVVHWKIPNKGATNKTGFSALPGGFRLMNGEFGYIGEFGRWWTSSEENSYIGFSWMLSYNNGQVVPNWPSKRVGLSVRCLKDNFKDTSNSSINGKVIQNSVRGIVLTEDGKPLDGTNILSTGTLYTSHSATTGSDGRFLMNDVQADAALLLVDLDIKGQSHKADFKSEMTVKLVKDPEYKETITNDEITISIDGPKVQFKDSKGLPVRALIVIDGVVSKKTGEAEINYEKVNSRKDFMESIKILKDKEATDKYGEKGKNGVIEITTNKKTIVPVVQEVNFRNSDFTPASAMVVINGMILESKDHLRVNPGEIESYKILKDKEAISKYGDKGKDGVLEIVLYNNFPGLARKKRVNPDISDTSKYITLLHVNQVSIRGELIDIAVSNLQSVTVCTYQDALTKNKKELRTISIMTKDYYKVKGRVVQENGKPLSGVKISLSEFLGLYFGP